MMIIYKRYMVFHIACVKGFVYLIEKDAKFQLSPTGIGKQVSGYKLCSPNCIGMCCYFKKNLDVT